MLPPFIIEQIRKREEEEAQKKAAEERERLIKCRVLGATGTARTITDEDGLKVALRVPAKGGPSLRLSKYDPPALPATA